MDDQGGIFEPEIDNFMSVRFAYKSTEGIHCAESLDDDGQARITLCDMSPDP
jgi:hypothetical protein